jgi:GT2 family glycosyltransferase
VSGRIPVALVNWDAIEMVELCIKYIHDRTEPGRVTIHVVDNGSEDPKNVKRLVELKKLGQIDNVISLPRNMGFPIAFNIAVEETTGDVFTYVSGDCLVEHGWLEAGLSTLNSDENIAAACSNIILDDKGRKLSESDEDMELPELYGAIMFIRRKVWSEVGCFDYLNFSPGYAEESDWSLRARRKGYKIVLSQKSLAYHDESYTMRKKYNKADLRLFRLTHRIKHRLMNWSRKEFLLFWKWYLIELIEEIRNGTIHILFAALMKNLLMLPVTWRERRKRSLGQTIPFEYPYKREAVFI